MFDKSLFLSKFAKNLDFGRNFREIMILVEIFQKSRFCRNAWQMASLVDIFRKIPILVEISEIFDFGRNC